MLLILALLIGQAPSSPGSFPRIGTQVPIVDESAWLQSYDEALELARESGRDVLVDFTGSDWCKWCKKLDREVFGRPTFQETASASYVLVKVDMPRSKPALAKVPDIKRNRALAREHQIRSWPTILLMTSGGHVYGRLGYEEGGADNYWSEIQGQRQEFRAPLVEGLQISREFKEAQGAKRATLARRALELLPMLPPTSPAIEGLVPVVGYFAELDPDNERGDLARALRVILPSGFANAQQIELGVRLDPRNELGLNELTLLARAYRIENERETRQVTLAIIALDAMGPFKSEVAARTLYSNGAVWSDRVLRDVPKAKDLARKALPYLKTRPQLEAKMRRILAKQG